MPLTPTQQAFADKLAAAFGAFVDSVGGPGVAGATAGPWHRDKGPEPTPGETAIGNDARARQFFARGLRVDGTTGLVEPDLSYALDLADFFVASTTTAKQAEDKLNGCINTTRDSTIGQLLSGQFRNDLRPGVGGAPALMYPGRSFEDLLKAPGTPVGGNVAGV